MKPGKFHRSFFENAFLNSNSTSPNNFATNLMMHKTHGRVVQVVEESYDNCIRIYSRPRETRSHSPSCRPELQEPVREQDKYCSEQHWSPVTNKNKTFFFFLFNRGFVVKCWFTNTYHDALESRTQFLDREGDSALPHILWHGPEVAFKLTFLERLKATENNSAAEIQDQCFALSQCSYTS